MTWQDIAVSFANTLFTKAAALGATFGLGGGVGIVKFLAHCPAPKTTNRWGGAIYDTFQDLVSNKDRIGERRTDDGTIIYLQKPKRPVPPEGTTQ